MNKTYQVSRQKATAILHKIAKNKKQGGFGGAYTETKNGACSDAISAYFNENGLHIQSLFPASKTEEMLGL